MSEVVVRGQWLTGAVKFLRARYPAETNERLLGALPKPLRAQLVDIQPVAWYARAYHVDMLNSIVSSHRDQASVEHSLLGYGELVAADAAKAALRPLLQIITPKLLARKLPELWVLDHQHDGRIEVDIAQVDEGRLALKLAGLDGYPHVGVATLGFIRGLLSATGRRDVLVEQTGWSLSSPAPDELTCEVRWS